MLYTCLQCGGEDFIRMESLNVSPQTGVLIEGMDQGRSKCGNCGTVVEVDGDGNITRVAGTSRQPMARSGEVGGQRAAGTVAVRGGIESKDQLDGRAATPTGPQSQFYPGRRQRT